jgi:hypothetical protein
MGNRISRVIAVAALAVALASATTAASWRALAAEVTGRPRSSESLLGAFVFGADQLRRRQDPEGYWKTPVTLRPVFEHATPELNVFTPAMIVDLLDPIAQETGLHDVLEQARGYLRRQIEATGLVRYHGNPGPVDPSNRGCEMPPDADDTALVWRIAPKRDAQLLRSALETLARYRDPDDLYPTYLADQTDYRCFYGKYSGSDLNPPDVGVEMHVYLLLAKHDAGAADKLCTTLRSRMAEKRIWVWYSVAPLLPLLREIDLARSGCPVRVPRHLLRTDIAGQQAYLTQTLLLRSLLLNDGPAVSLEPVLRALRAVARDRFVTMSRTPPLLYHNDLSATPPHYHWSEDVGYALWLRLYVEGSRRFPHALPLPKWPVKIR